MRTLDLSATLNDADLQRVRDAIERDDLPAPRIGAILAMAKPVSPQMQSRFRDRLGIVPLARGDADSRTRLVAALQDGSLERKLNGSVPHPDIPLPPDVEPPRVTPQTTQSVTVKAPKEVGRSKRERAAIDPDLAAELGRTEKIIDWPDEVPVADDIDRESLPTANLPEEFWSARPILSTIRQAAYSRMVSADALFGAVVTRLTAGVPHQIRIPPTVGTRVPLSMIVNLTGSSGTGKSAANGTSVELIPLGPEVIDQMPIGSGEGLVEMLFDMEEQENAKGKPIKVKVQKYRNAHVYIDEGAALTALAERKDSIVLSTIRTIYSGGVLGQTNASSDTKRRVPGGEHTFGIVIAIQETVAAALLEHEADGTPQRFLWLSAIDPNAPDPDDSESEWPGELHPLAFLRQVEPTGDFDAETVAKVKAGPHIGYMPVGQPYDLEVAAPIRREVKSARLSTLRGDGTVDPIRAHENLTRLKVAGCLAILDQRLDINPEDWRLAGMVMATSNKVLARTRTIIREDEARKDAKTSKRAAQRQVVVVTALDDHAAHLKRVEHCATWIKNRVQAEPGITVTGLRRVCSNRLRDVYDEALARALKLGWVEERSETGTGLGSNAKRALYPGGDGDE